MNFKQFRQPGEMGSGTQYLGPSRNPGLSYRKIIPRTVPVATIKAKTNSASKSERISLMVVTPFM
jgi:hypothetical protein